MTERKRLPDTRESITYKFQMGWARVYVTAGKYPDGSLGEIFVSFGKPNIAKDAKPDELYSAVCGFANAWAKAFSMCLQYGVPVEDMIRKFENVSFEPKGISKGKIRFASSVIDHVAKWLKVTFHIDDSMRRDSIPPARSEQ